MDFADQNPVLIQDHSLQASSVPLFLIHDGGGTINPYFALGALGRDVYGIYNPQFEEKCSRRVDIVEMAEGYCRRVKETSESEDILLGGEISLMRGGSLCC